MTLDIEHINKAREHGMKRAAERLRNGNEDEGPAVLWENVDVHELALRVTGRKLPEDSDDLIEFQDAYEEGYYDVFDNFDSDDVDGDGTDE